MGPRFCKRGNAGYRLAVVLGAALQWGHAFVSVETIDRTGGRGLHQRASMGPRFCKRGNRRQGVGETLSKLASMGPRFCKRGNKTIAARRVDRD